VGKEDIRYAGRLTEWNDAKGYGFVEPNGGGDRAFVHIKAFGRLTRRPREGDLVSYKVTQDAQQRANAVAVQLALATSKRAMPVASRRFPRKGFALAFAAALGAAWWLGKIPAFVIGFYGAMSVFAYCLYWRDKMAAQRGDWRTSEKALHFAAVFGGWPGALVAQDVFRHKSSKASFQIEFWSTVVINCAVMAWLVRGAMR